MLNTLHLATKNLTQLDINQSEENILLMNEFISWSFLIVWLISSILYVIETRKLRNIPKTTLKDYFRKITYPGIVTAAMLVIIATIGGNSLLFLECIFAINILGWMAVYSFLCWRSDVHS
jgi:hypothetical protein